MSICPTCGAVLTRSLPTRRQRDVLDAIAAITAREGRPPTFAQVAEHIGVTAMSTIYEHVENLRAKGLLLPAEPYAHNTLIVAAPTREEP